MTTIAKKYGYLYAEAHPNILKQALLEYGVSEKSGYEDNPKILHWAYEIGGSVGRAYKNDSIPWCGLFIGICAKRSNLKVPENPLWALNWATWGTQVDTPMLGDVLVFKRDGGGHVALYVGEDDTHYHILGGNQHDSVCIVRKPKSELYAARRTEWKIAEPKNIRRIFLSESGIMSGKEV